MFRKKLTPPKSQDGSSRIQSQMVAFFETHYPRFVRYFLVRCDIHAEAEDLASELFYRALRSSAFLFDSSAQTEAWLYTTAHNMVVDFFRRKERERRLVPLEGVPDVSSNDDDATQWATAIDQKEDLARVIGAMQHLSEGQRQILALRYSDGLTGPEIARLLNKKPGAVREMQRAAIAKLRYIIKDTQRYESYPEENE